MSLFGFYSAEDAPAGSRPLLQKVAARFGFVPSLLGGLAESPAALEGYLAIAANFERSSLSAIEQQVVAIATSVENGCEFCVSAHSFMARNLAKADPALVEALRQGDRPADARAAAIAHFTRLVVRNRGWVGDSDVEEFLAAGFSRAQVLEVVLGVSQKTLSNYANHLLKTPLDSAFESERWHRAA